MQPVTFHFFQDSQLRIVLGPLQASVNAVDWMNLRDEQWKLIATALQ